MQGGGGERRMRQDGEQHHGQRRDKAQQGDASRGALLR